MKKSIKRISLCSLLATSLLIGGCNNTNNTNNNTIDKVLPSDEFIKEQEGLLTKYNQYFKNGLSKKQYIISSKEKIKKPNYDLENSISFTANENGYYFLKSNHDLYGKPFKTFKYLVKENDVDYKYREKTYYHDKEPETSDSIGPDAKSIFDQVITNGNFLTYFSSVESDDILPKNLNLEGKKVFEINDLMIINIFPITNYFDYNDNVELSSNTIDNKEEITLEYHLVGKINEDISSESGIENTDNFSINSTILFKVDEDGLKYTNMSATIKNEETKEIFASTSVECNFKYIFNEILSNFIIDKSK